MRWRTTVDGEPWKRATSDVATKLMQEKGLGAHSDHVGALGDDEEGSEWSSHVKAVIRALRAVEVDVSGRGDVRERGG
jgi:hypothetical protein